MLLACRGYLLGAIPVLPWSFHCCVADSFAAECRSSTGRQSARGSSEARFITTCNTRTCFFSKTGSGPPHSKSSTRCVFIHALSSGLCCIFKDPSLVSLRRKGCSKIIGQFSIMMLYACAVAAQIELLARRNLAVRSRPLHTERKS